MFSITQRKSPWLLLLVLFLGTANTAAADFRPVKGPKVEGQYLVVFKDEHPAREVAHEIAFSHGGRVDRTWDVVNGALFTRMTEARARALAQNPKVAWVEEDSEVSVSAVRSNALWGLDRIDQRALPLSTNYYYDFNGNGIHVYVLDTGIRQTHQQFGSRVSLDADFMNDGQTGSDCHGHGTHVAGTIGGSTYGVANQVRLHSVRVLGCNGFGTASSAIDGINWVANNAQRPAVANMSLESAVNVTLDTAVNNAANAGIFVAVAAGNGGADACNTSPARAAGAFTVGAVNSSDTRADFSNFGACVDIFAPGVGIISASSLSDAGYSTKDGTSMAAPHVAGVAALLLEEDRNLSVAALRERLLYRATRDVVQSAGANSPDDLLYSRYVPPVGAPGTPSYLDVQPLLCYGYHDISWGSVSGATYYELYQASSSSYIPQTRIYSGTDTYYFANVSSTRYYRVRACNANGCSYYELGDRAATVTNGCL